MRSLLLFAILSTVLCTSPSSPATTFYVHGSVSSSGDGKSWETAFKTIQEGIDAASDGDTAIVAEGIYLENIHFDGKNIVLTSTDSLDPSIAANTIIDGNLAGPVVIFSGTENETCALSGFTVRNGASVYGGGIWGNGTRATLRNNEISANSVEGHYTGFGAPLQPYWVEGKGAGLWACNGTIENNVIARNSANGEKAKGGGLACCHGTIRNNTIRENSAVGERAEGAGIYDCDGLIQSNSIAGNWVGGFYASGGGLDVCSGMIENNTIVGNNAEYACGGLIGCHGTVRGNLISCNSADYASALGWCGGTIINNTIAGNLCRREGHALEQCYGEIRNCIIWSNTAAGNEPELYGTSQPAYSCIRGWSGGGQGNIADDPRFADPDGADDNPQTFADNDYRLWIASPCIDAGANEDWMWTSRDLDGNPRVFNGGLSLTVDMGAYEHGPWSFRVAQVVVETPGAFQLTWTSRPGETYAVWSCVDLRAAEWTELATVPSQGGLTSWTDIVPFARLKFYRVKMK